MVQSLMTSLVLSLLDYGKATLAGFPQQLLQRLQSVMKAAARLIYASSKFDHIGQAAPSPTSLAVQAKQRIDFRLAVAYLCSNVYTGLRLHTSPMNLVVQLIT